MIPTASSASPRSCQRRSAFRPVELASDSIYRARQAAVVRRAAPNARIVDVPGAMHYVFLTNEADVVREINVFLTSLAGVP